MARHLTRWLASTLAILMIPHLVRGIRVENFGTALAVAAVLGVLNVLVRPLLILITLPLTLLSLGFFLLIINALMFWAAGSFVTGMEVDSFGAAFLASLIVSIVSWITNLSLKREKDRVVWGVHGERRRSMIEMERGENGKWE